MVGGEQQSTLGLASGTTGNILGFRVAFDYPDSTAMLHFHSTPEGLMVSGPMPIVSMQMGTDGGMEYPAGQLVAFNEGTLYAVGQIRMALQKYTPSAVRKVVKAPAGQTGGHLSAVMLDVVYRGMHKQVLVPGLPRMAGKPVKGQMGDLSYEISYGSREIALPFALFLKDFQVERYPGSNSPSSFASEVVLVDKEMGIKEERRIFMNNVLKHRGYRFYQSSYDNDEQGTILSVNKDLAGTFVTYLGYALLILGMFLALFVRHTRFARMASLSSKPAKLVALLFLMLAPAFALSAQEVPPADVARELGHLWVQDKGGRYKPLNTLSNEVVHKVTKKAHFESYNADQVMLGMILYPDVWKEKPLFEIKSPALHEIVGFKGEKVSFNDLMDSTQTYYLLSEVVNQAYSKQVVEQSELDREVIKLDDRVNAMFLVQSGALLRIFPDPDAENHKWASVSDRLMGHEGHGDSKSSFFLQYLNHVRVGDYDSAGKALDMIRENQHNLETLLPSESRKNLEIFYNRLNVFPRLAKFYGLFGLMLLVFQFMLVFRPKPVFRYLFRVGVIHLAVAFAIHTVALGIRWYVSGHAPMSNGYESMIFVSWVTLLAGLILVKRSGYAMALTAVLAALSLLVAGMSNMNPEITNLVPVLKSPWLTIHVAVIMAGYGFLGLASIMGLMNVVLYALLTPGNKKRLEEVIAQVTTVNHMTLIIGLYFMTAGVFLGGVWANESWGRYWGWDPKETWALITVIVYAFVAHMHRIPGMRGNYAYNLASFISYASVMMTYFGVNYFLGGMHSYASGSAFKIPFAVYAGIGAFVALGIFAYRRSNKHLPDSTPDQ